MDITDQVLALHRTYGSSDCTNQGYTSSARQLNYANGASIQKPEVTNISAIPYTFSFKDTVGLFGSENHFVKVQLKVEGETLSCYEEPFWLCARLSTEEMDPADPYTFTNDGTTSGAAYIDVPAEELDVDYKSAALIRSEVPSIARPMVKVELKNLKTGNKYTDAWLDVRLYTMDRQEHPYDVMYLGKKDFFYIGFHARNTKRLPYNVECTIGEEFLSENQIDSAYMMHKIS